MFASFTDKYRSLRKQQYLDKLGDHRHQYAFIGAGAHSLHQLYPILRHLNVPLRYICTRTPASAQKVAASFPGCTPVTSIDPILADGSVKGVFVCTLPKLHHDLARLLLQAGKAVFIDKPPTHSAAGLEELIRTGTGTGTGSGGDQPFVTGLQRRFSTIRRLLDRRNLSQAIYQYQYITGAYPEGNPVYELFIHPVDFALTLFGPATIQAILPVTAGRLRSWTIHLGHANGTNGILHLSTSGSWSAVAESLQITTEKELLEARYPFYLAGTRKPFAPAGIPLDKIMPRPLLKKIYLDNQGAVPSLANNSLVNQGFFGEIDHFIDSVEKGKPSPESSLLQLRPLYEVLDRLDAAGVR